MLKGNEKVQVLTAGQKLLDTEQKSHNFGTVQWLKCGTKIA